MTCSHGAVAGVRACYSLYAGGLGGPGIHMHFYGASETQTLALTLPWLVLGFVLAQLMFKGQLIRRWGLWRALMVSVTLSIAFSGVLGFFVFRWAVPTVVIGVWGGAEDCLVLFLVTSGLAALIRRGTTAGVNAVMTTLASV